MPDELRIYSRFFAAIQFFKKNNVGRPVPMGWFIHNRYRIPSHDIDTLLTHLEKITHGMNCGIGLDCCTMTFRTSGEMYLDMTGMPLKREGIAGNRIPLCGRGRKLMTECTSRIPGCYRQVCMRGIGCRTEKPITRGHHTVVIDECVCCGISAAVDNDGTKVTPVAQGCCCTRHDEGVAPAHRRAGKVMTCGAVGRGGLTGTFLVKRQTQDKYTDYHR